MYTFQLQHLITVCDSGENLCPDRDLIFLEDVLGTVATPNGAGTVPDITKHDMYALIYTGPGN